MRLFVFVRALGLLSPGCLLVSFVPAQGKMERKAIAEKCKKDPTFHAGFMKDVTEWESNKINGIKNGSAITSHGARQTVKAVQTCTIEKRQRLGYFWPLDVYKRVKGVVPHKKLIKKMPWQGKQIRGVLLDDTHGTPTGVIEMISKAESGVEKVDWLQCSVSYTWFAERCLCFPNLRFV
jgi:hypothetical protein